MPRKPAIQAELDPEFQPAVLWNRWFHSRVEQSDCPQAVRIVLQRPDNSGSTFETRILPSSPANDSLNFRYLERTLKFLLWQRGATTVQISGCDALTARLASTYSPEGRRGFDHNFFSQRVYRTSFQLSACPEDQLPQPVETGVALGGNLNGCRIGFDLGGSDRKCAAVIDGKVVYSEEVEWNPYFERDPTYHVNGIQHSLERAAAHLPRVDGIGGSAAGVYVNNQIRAASLFRGVSPEDFESRVRSMFFELGERWNVPFDVVNDGDVTALAGAMHLNTHSVLGVAMGTSQAVGYVGPRGTLTPMLNELAFAPVDYREHAPEDEWSGDNGCGVQYFSQQAVARLAPAAGFDFPDGLPYPEQLIEIQRAMALGDQRAASIYSTIGTYLGYSLAHYADFYEIRTVLLLGRVMSGFGGEQILDQARLVLKTEFPNLHAKIELVTLDEKTKRHGQAAAAASLPEIRGPA